MQVTCVIALLQSPLIVSQFSQEATALYTVPFKYQQLWYKCLLQWRICLLVDVRVCGVECDHAVALIDDAEYGNNCGCGPVICGVR